MSVYKTIYAKNGKVGIGTNNPAEKLEINSGNLLLKGNTPRIIFKSNNGSHGFQMLANHSDVADFGFGIIPNPTGNAEALSISTNGNVGIGTQNPGGKLHVKNGRIRVEGHDSDRSGVLELRNYNTDINYIFTAGLNQHGKIGDLVFQTASSSKHFIFDRSNVGIGTNKPIEKLHVMGNITTQVKSNEDNFIELVSNSGRAYVLNNNGHLFLRTYNSKYLIINDDGGGNVGIGTNNPQNKLHVNGGVTVGGTNGAHLAMHTNEINCVGGLYLQYPGNSGNLNLCFGGGKVGIGISPSNILHVQGDSWPLRIQRKTSQNTYLEFDNNQIRSIASTLYLNFNSTHNIVMCNGGGYVGIGTAYPGAKLDITGSYYNNLYGTRDTYTIYHVSNYWVSTMNAHKDDDFSPGYQSWSLWVSNSSWMKGNVYFSSDRRIKENIVDISDNISLQYIRDISCVSYYYKDKLKNGSKQTIGFIAQQVHSVFPQAVSIEHGIIPNEMRLLTDISWNNTTMITDEIQEDVSGVKYRFYVSNDISGNDECIKDVIGNQDNTFTFDQSWNNIFCYGKEVDNFNVLDKNKLYALNFSATQQIDRIQQQQLIDISGNSLAIDINKNELELLKLENQELTNKITSLETELNNLKTLVESLVNNN